MKRFAILWLLLVCVIMLVFAVEQAMAQFTEEFIVCQDGSSPDACRDTAVDPGPDEVVVWDRTTLGNTLCAGVGLMPQETDCFFGFIPYEGFRCSVSLGVIFSVNVPAGHDLAVACIDITDSVPGDYSGMARDNFCFGGASGCRNVTVQ